MSDLNREQVREAVARWDQTPSDEGLDARTEIALRDAAQAWLDLEGAVIIRRDEDGEWPDRVVGMIMDKREGKHEPERHTEGVGSSG